MLSLKLNFLLFPFLLNAKDKIKNQTYEPTKNCSIKYRNIALTQDTKKGEDIKKEEGIFKIQINPTFIDVIICQQNNYSFYEKIMQFASISLFWLDFSLKDLINLYILILIKLGLKKKEKN